MESLSIEQINKLQEENQQLRKLLDEIKKIASPHCTQCIEILDKISEVLK